MRRSSTRRRLERPREEPARTDTREHEIYLATREVLAEVGFDRLTMDAVAARARAGKATLYRHWPSKERLVIDAVTACRDNTPATGLDTGTLRGDLRELARCAAGIDEFDVRAMNGLLTAMSHNPELADMFERTIMRAHAEELREIFERARRRGEIPAERDIETLLLVGQAVVVHRLWRRRPIDDEFVQWLTDAIILPLATAPITTPESAPPADLGLWGQPPTNTADRPAPRA